MKRKLAMTAAILAAGCGASTAPVAFEAGSERAPIDPGAEVERLAAGFNEAGFELFLAQEATENTVLSPLSIGHALLMAEAAAGDATAASIASTFGLPADAHSAWNNLDLDIDATNRTATGQDQTPTPIVTVAARVWPRTGSAPGSEWLDLMATHHGAGTESIDVSKPQESADRINAWISDETDGLIPKLVPANFINSSTVLVLTDAVYFEAEWTQTFGKYGAPEREFNNLDGTTTKTRFNRDLEQPGGRGLGDGYTAAELPYKGDDYSMLLIVPDAGEFETVRSRLSNELIAEADSILQEGPWELELPEWETDTSIDFLAWLQDKSIAPGSFPAFGEGVFLGGAVHGANVSVDDMGTVAAAATALGFEESGPPEPELQLFVDRPFLYLIRHADSGAVMFVGEVVQL